MKDTPTMKLKCIGCSKIIEKPLSELEGLEEAPTSECCFMPMLPEEVSS